MSLKKPIILTKKDLYSDGDSSDASASTCASSSDGQQLLIEISEDIMGPSLDEAMSPEMLAEITCQIDGLLAKCNNMRNRFPVKTAKVRISSPGATARYRVASPVRVASPIGMRMASPIGVRVASPVGIRVASPMRTPYDGSPYYQASGGGPRGQVIHGGPSFAERNACGDLRGMAIFPATGGTGSLRRDEKEGKIATFIDTTAAFNSKNRGSMWGNAGAGAWQYQRRDPMARYTVY